MRGSTVIQEEQVLYKVASPLIYSEALLHWHAFLEVPLNSLVQNKAVNNYAP